MLNTMALHISYYIQISGKCTDMYTYLCTYVPRKTDHGDHGESTYARQFSDYKQTLWCIQLWLGADQFS
jgi:hypothetical protein